MTQGCRMVNRVQALILAAVVLAGPSARQAAAQGGFYAEERRDGRIYVFALMADYENFKKTGEMGKSITRIGRGPVGETMVFDSEEAIHLYNFKHDRPPEVITKPEEKKPVMKVGWKDGKTTIETDKAKLIISNRIQFRYTVEDKEDKDAKGSFRVRRAKTKFDGFFYTPKLTYELQLNWADTVNVLEDANLNVDFLGTQAIQLKVGQFKVPFRRQQLTSSGSQQFVERWVEFARDRDQGIQLWGATAGTKIEWRLGVFNGNGRNKPVNDNSEYQYNGRIMFQPFGDVKYSEGDFESTDTPLFAIAADFEINDLRPLANDEGDPIGTKREIFGVDTVFKYKGFSAMWEGFFRSITPEAEEADEFDSPGWLTQVGYFIVPQRLEVAGRYATWDPTDAKDGNDRLEYGIAGGYFWNKHNLKLQGDWRRLEDEAKDTEDNEYRFQAQWIF